MFEKMRWNTCEWSAYIERSETCDRGIIAEKVLSNGESKIHQQMQNNIPKASMEEPT
jgi:hypothetical protein